MRRVRLTWNRDEELDGVPVAVEGELCLGHGAEGREGPGDHSVSSVSVHSDRAARLAVLYHVLDQVPRLGLGHLRGLQRDADDDPVACPQPESVAAHVESRDADEGEAEFACTCKE